MTICFAIIATVCLVCLIGIMLEYRDFNHGICPYCWTKLRYFDTDSQGGRGYCCDTCGYHTWVSYGFVDKDFKEEEE
jgi:predicted amidophosphoribosyltransferase